jgi:hypothetical protein
VAFPALRAKAEGYKVYAVMDASGDPSEMASRMTLARLTQAGVIPVSTNVVICELQRTWNRPDAEEFAVLYAACAPNYQAVIESFRKAQDVLKQEKKKESGPRRGQRPDSIRPQYPPNSGPASNLRFQSSYPMT